MEAYLPLLILLFFIFVIVQAFRYHKIKRENRVGTLSSIEPVVLPKKARMKSAEGSWVKMSTYKTKVVGVTKTNPDGRRRQEIIKWLRPLDKIELVREPSNAYDVNAIKVISSKGQQIGYIDSNRASELAPQIDKGYQVESHIHEILSVPNSGTLGVLISVQRQKPKSG